MVTEKQEVEIDLRQLLQVLWHKLWLIVLAMFLFAGAAFAATYYFVTPLYTATAKLYVNNTAFALGSTKADISSADIAASQSLVDTYIVILETRTTLEQVIAEADLDYTYSQLTEMIAVAAVNGTEIFQIDVKSPNPVEAKLIANTIAEVSPNAIAQIVDGSSARVVDYAITPATISSPNYQLNTMIGALLGIVISCLLVVLQMMLNEIIQSEEDLTQRYDLPILTVIPNIRTGKSDNAYRNNYKKRAAYRAAQRVPSMSTAPPTAVTASAKAGEK